MMFSSIKCSINFLETIVTTTTVVVVVVVLLARQIFLPRRTH